MTKIVVYSCVTGAYDNVSKTLLSKLPVVDCDVSFVLFLDKHSKVKQTDKWQILPLAYEHPLCRRRTARWHKLSSHVLFPDADISVWIDGSQSFKPIRLWADLIQPVLQWDLATFRHPLRNCVYQELNACIQLKKDNELLMRQQVQSYQADGYPARNGMVETACVIRKHNERTMAFNEAWLAELSKFSYRDQLSFNYVATKLKLPYGTIAGHRELSPYFNFTWHK